MWNELPIRISPRTIELSSSVYNLSNTAPIKDLLKLYTHSFHMLESSNVESSETEFISETINHFNTLKPALNGGDIVIPECQFSNGFLDRFHSPRIGTRLLNGQYIAYVRNNKLLCLSSPKEILEAAIGIYTQSVREF